MIRFYPRDTKDQIKHSTKRFYKGVILKKGDVIFWKGHVAICINSQRINSCLWARKKSIELCLLYRNNK